MDLSLDRKESMTEGELGLLAMMDISLFLFVAISACFNKQYKIGNNMDGNYCGIMEWICKIYLDLIQRFSFIIPYLFEIAWSKSGYLFELVT